MRNTTLALGLALALPIAALGAERRAPRDPTESADAVDRAERDDEGAAESDRQSSMSAEKADGVRALFRARAEAGRFSGAVAVAQDGKLILESGYGWAEVEHEVPMRPDHIFRIGSLTKPFTAGAVLLAVRAGRLSLVDPICGLIQGCPISWSDVTIEHLLTHTSGIRDHFGDLEAVPVEDTMGELSRVLATLAPDESLEGRPGEGYSYANFNYVLLGAALETVYLQPWELVLRKLVLDPLGLEDTAYDRVERPVTRRVRGYDRAEDGSLRIIDYDDHAAYAAGGLYSTAGDLLTWSNALFSGALLGDLTEPTFTPFRGNYGYGWQIREFFGRRMFNHSGGIDGFSSHLAHYQDEGLTIVVLTNVESDSAILNACDVAASWFAWEDPSGTPEDRASLPPRLRCGLEPASP